MYTYFHCWAYDLLKLLIIMYTFQVADSAMLKVKFTPSAVLEDVQPIRCAAFHPGGRSGMYNNVWYFQGYNIVAVVAVSQLLPLSATFRNFFFFPQFPATMNIFRDFAQLSRNFIAFCNSLHQIVGTFWDN